jgi:hypothetical protein
LTSPDINLKGREVKQKKQEFFKFHSKGLNESYTAQINKRIIIAEEKYTKMSGFEKHEKDETAVVPVYNNVVTS